MSLMAGSERRGPAPKFAERLRDYMLDTLEGHTAVPQAVNAFRIAVHSAPNTCTGLSPTIDFTLSAARAGTTTASTRSRKFQLGTGS
jgi:hypothetical protein